MGIKFSTHHKTCRVIDPGCQVGLYHFPFGANGKIGSIFDIPLIERTAIRLLEAPGCCTGFLIAKDLAHSKALLLQMALQGTAGYSAGGNTTFQLKDLYDVLYAAGRAFLTECNGSLDNVWKIFRQCSHWIFSGRCFGYQAEETIHLVFFVPAADGAIRHTEMCSKLVLLGAKQTGVQARIHKMADDFKPFRSPCFW